MASMVYDVIVVGAGIQGSSTAYQLAKRGRKVLLLDQFPLPHNRGSSHGHTRITRRGYGKDNFYTVMATDSQKLTMQLEQEVGEKLFINCGSLLMGESGNEVLTSSEMCFKQFNIPYEKFGSYEQRQRYPNISFPDDYVFLLDKTGGVLKADKLLRAYQNQTKHYGCEIKDSEQMQRLVPGTTVSVVTSKHVYSAKSVVLTLGPWAAKFLPQLGLSLPLKPLKITVTYWKEKNPGEFGNFPAFASREKHSVYGSPSDEYPGLVKICYHHGPEVDPDDLNNVDSQWVTDKMMSFISRHFPTLENRPSISEQCMYTMTPDQNFILDSHPEWRNVIIGAGFSGHGFKMGPVVGCILADLATGVRPSYDMAPFSVTRFTKHKL